MSSLLTPTKPTQAMEDLRKDVRSFLRASIAQGRFTPETDSWQSAVDADFSRELASRGWIGMTVPTEYGGRGRTALERFVVVEELLAHGAPVAAHWIADRQMAPSILRHGTEAQKQKYLPGICRGERFFAIGMSEPDSGSDLASVRTQATRVEGGFTLTGTKVWTTVAHVAHNMIVLARTSSGERHEGLSQFIVDLPNPQVKISPIYTIDGQHHFNEVVFDGAFVPEDALLGAEGSGWHQVTAELANERSGPERFLSTFSLLEEWAKTVTGDPVAELELGRLVSRIHALRQMSLAVAAQLAAGKEPAQEAALVKDLGTTFEGELVETIRRLTQPGTLQSNQSLLQLLIDGVRHTPAFTLRGGTNEVLRSIVSKGV